MEMFKNLSVAKKLYTMVIIASFFILLVSIIGYSFNAKAAKSLQLMYKEHLVAVAALGDTRSNLNRILADELNLLQYTNAQETNALLDSIKSRRDENTTLLEDYIKTNPSKEELDILTKLKEIRLSFNDNVDRVLSLAMQNKNAQAYALYKSNIKTVEEYRTIVKDLLTLQKNISETLFQENKKATDTANALLIIIGISSLVLMISIGIIVANGVTKPIQQAIGELTTGSSEVSAAANQVEAASQQLAAGATQQAASIQETSSALEETASMVQQNNENTRQAAIMAKAAKDFAQESNREMSSMMDAMEELTKSSNEIAKIIKVIDEIAFQTNILSLNAAVEAARAGDAGKGFAVVAEEVRNLAQRSAQAAKDTAVIIESNISMFENSVGIAKNVNESLVKIDDESRKVSELLDEIATATEEQTRGIAEINKAIQQMEDVLQTNSSTAEESSAAAIELSSQAENVSQIVTSLIVLVEGANTMATAGYQAINASRSRTQLIGSGSNLRNF